MKFFQSILISLALLTSGCFGQDAGTFAPASAPTAAAANQPAATVAIAPATNPAPVNPVPAPVEAPGFFWTFLQNATVVSVLAALVLRGENFLQSKTKLDITKGQNLAHTIFVGLRDAGYIKTGSATDAIDRFWNELNRQSQEQLGHAPNALIENHAHGTFVRLLNDHFATAAKAPVVNAKAPVLINGIPQVTQG